MKKKPLFTVSEILDSDFNKSLKMKRHNAEKLNLGPIQTKRYIEAFAIISQYRRSEHFAGIGTGAEALALQTIFGYERKMKDE